jgi:dUTPase
MKTPTFRFALREDLKDEKMFLPRRGEPSATGWDCRAAQSNRKPIILAPGEYFKIELGFRAFPEEGWWFQLHPRSSSFVKKFMHCLIGTIDTHFEGQLILAGQYSPDIFATGASVAIKEDLVINFGDALCQIIPIKRQEMEILDISNEEYNDLCNKRGAIRKGGFGSTDELPKAIDELSITTRYIDPFESNK